VGNQTHRSPEERSERIRQKRRAIEAYCKKQKPDPKAAEALAHRIATELYKSDLGDVRQFNTKEEALEIARRLAGVPEKELTEDEIRKKKEEVAEKAAINHITDVLLSSSIKKGSKSELNLARICKLVGADPYNTDLGDVDRAKVIRNFKKLDAESLGLVDEERRRILKNWWYSIDLKNEDGSPMNLPLKGMNLEKAVRALGWVGWKEKGSELKRATERYRKMTDRLLLEREDKKCRKAT
jgi:hypothetical protein